MARSANVWVLEQYGSSTGEFAVIATFTVKHELQYMLERLPLSSLRRCRVKKFKDGVCFQQTYDEFQPDCINVPMSLLTERIK